MDEINQLLDDLEGDFQGFDWRPLDFLPYYYLKLLLRNVEGFYERLEPLALENVFGGPLLVRERFLMLLELKKANRWQYRDNVTFLIHLSDALAHARQILERLRILRSTGKLK